MAIKDFSISIYLESPDCHVIQLWEEVCAMEIIRASQQKMRKKFRLDRVLSNQILVQKVHAHS